MPNRTCGLALVATLLTAGLSLPANAGEDQASTSAKPLPPAIATYIERGQLESDFRECVAAEVKKQALTDDDLIKRIAAKGLAKDVYAAVSAEMDENPDEILEADGFVPAHADPDEALAEKSMVLAKTMMQRTLDGEDDSLTPTRAFDRFFVAVNQAVDADCEVPAHLLPGGDTLRAQAEAIAPLLVEADRVNDCVTSEIEARGMDEAAVFALLEKKNLSDEYRARALDIAANMPGVDEANRAKVAAYENPYELGTALTMLSAMTFELESMAKATGVNAIYLDRALDGKCNPNNELKTFIGAANSANH